MYVVYWRYITYYTKKNQEQKLTQNSNSLYTVTTRQTKRINTDILFGRQELISTQDINCFKELTNEWKEA